MAIRQPTIILHIVENSHKLDAFVATSQVGITISSLVLGFYGQAQLSPYLVTPLNLVWEISQKPLPFQLVLPLS